MLKAYEFGEWTPDLANNVLIEATNVRAIANGYAPINGPQAVTAVFANTFMGGGSFIASDGTSVLLGAGPTLISKYTGSAWSTEFSYTANDRVHFAQFGDNVLVAGKNTIASYNLISGVATTPTAAPDMIDIVQVRDFVMGITTDNAVQWSQFNDSSTWTTGTNQADKQPILSSSGVRIIGGEYAILLKKQGVTRISYVGSTNDIIFQFDEISAEVGCMAAGSVCNVGRLIFFLSERGFMLCDGQDVTPIGDEKFNRWFFDSYSRQDIEGMWSAVDPRHSLVLWAMPGTPGKIIAYNWVLKRATAIEMSITAILTGFTAAVSLDALDAIYGNLDSIPISLDDPSLQGGNPILLIADGSNVLNSLTGDPLEATLALQNIEPTPGKRSRIRSIRLVSDADEATVTIDARMRAGDAEAIKSAATIRTNGKLPIRSNGRFNTIKVTIPSHTWEYIQGCELEFEPAEGR